MVWKGGDTTLVSIGLEGDELAGPMATDVSKWSYALQILGDQFGKAVVQDEALEFRSGDAVQTLIDASAGRRRFGKWSWEPEQGPDGRPSPQNLTGPELAAVGIQPDRSALEFERPDWKGNAFREYILKWRFYSVVPSSMKTANQSLAVPYLQEHGENFSSWLMTLQTKYGDEFERIARVARDAFPGLERLFTQPTQQATVLAATREKHLKGTISLKQMSDGELAFIALLSLIFSPPELASTLLVIEEPENYLHVRLLITFVELLRQVQQESSLRCPQVVITSHSPHLIDQFKLDELIVLEKREGATTVTRPADREHLRKLLEEEDVGLGSLYYSGALSSAS